MTTTVTLIPYTEHGVPSGNYDGSSLEFIGDTQKAANYYQGRGGSQTIRWTLTGAVAEITIQATLDPDPLTARWFELASYGDASSGDSTVYTDTHYQTIRGNFTWLRAQVENFQDGIIEVVSATY